MPHPPLAVLLELAKNSCLICALNSVFAHLRTAFKHGYFPSPERVVNATTGGAPAVVTGHYDYRVVQPSSFVQSLHEKSNQLVQVK